jgi:hypothetical protein
LGLRQTHRLDSRHRRHPLAASFRTVRSRSNVSLRWEGDLTGFHKPKMSPPQKEALQKGRAHIARKVKPGLKRLKAIEVARWQNGWVAGGLAPRGRSLERRPVG